MAGADYGVVEMKAVGQCCGAMSGQIRAGKKARVVLRKRVNAVRCDEPHVEPRMHAGQRLDFCPFIQIAKWADVDPGVHWCHERKAGDGLGASKPGDRSRDCT